MRKLINILLITLIVSGLFALKSCKPSPEKANQYYTEVHSIVQQVVMKEDTLILLIKNEMKQTLFDSSNSVLSKNKDTASLKDKIDIAYDEFCSQIDEAIKSLENLKKFDGKTTLKDKSIELMKLYREIAADDYQNLISIVKTPVILYTDNDDSKFQDMTIHIDTCLQDELENFTRSCKEFAHEYNFIIEEKNNLYL